MSPILYFGPEPHIHKREFRNPAFSVFELQGGTLNLDVKLNNDGTEVEGATINLYAVHYSHKTRHLDYSRMTPEELDEQAIRAMSGYPLRAWCDHFVPECAKPAWRSDTVLHRLPEGTIGYLLIATVAVTCVSTKSEKTKQPSKDPHIAIWKSENLTRC